MTLILLSLVVNVLVAGYMGLAIAFRLERMLPGLDEVFGPDSTSRQILACLYLAIAVCSIVALADSSLRLRIIVVLFPLQIFYKVLSAFLVTDRSNPVPKANLAISVLHCVSLYFAFTERSHPQRLTMLRSERRQAFTLPPCASCCLSSRWSAGTCRLRQAYPLRIANPTSSSS